MTKCGCDAVALTRKVLPDPDDPAVDTPDQPRSGSTFACRGPGRDAIHEGPGLAARHLLDGPRSDVASCPQCFRRGMHPSTTAVGLQGTRYGVTPGKFATAQ